MKNEIVWLERSCPRPLLCVTVTACPTLIINYLCCYFSVFIYKGK